MKLNEIYDVADALAPKRLSDEYCATYGAYDNSGILVDCGADVKGIVCSLDFSFAAIDKALELGANLIITHHPSVYGKIDRVRYDAADLTERKLVKCIGNGISVLSMHLNLDCAVGGVDESFAQGIALSSGGMLGACSVMHALQGGGYGRAYDITETTLDGLTENMKKTFSSERILSYGAGERKILRVASFCGAGADEESVAFAKANGADAIVSADFKHHVLTTAAESGLAVIAMTHYASERYGFKKYYEKICQRIDLPCAFHTDENLL